MITRAAKLQTRRSKAKQFTGKQQGDGLSSAGKKRAGLADVTNQLTVKHPAYHKKVNNTYMHRTYYIYNVISGVG